MPPLSSIILSIQGYFSILNGLASLISSSAATQNATVLGIDSIPAIHAIALGSMSIGTFYVPAAQNRDRRAMWLSVVGRAVAVGVFWGDGGPWRSVAVFEGVCGLALGGVLGWEEGFVRGEKGKDR